MAVNEEAQLYSKIIFCRWFEKYAQWLPYQWILGPYTLLNATTLRKDVLMTGLVCCCNAIFVWVSGKKVLSYNDLYVAAFDCIKTTG